MNRAIMIRGVLIAIAVTLAAPAVAQTAPTPAATDTTDWFKEFGVEKPKPDPVTGELPVKPYAMADANAGATPFAGDAMARAFGGKPGIRHLADRLVVLATTDPAIKGIFTATDTIRLRRTLYEQFCYILGAGCSYSGRDLREAHRQLGIRTGEMNALVVDLQRAMHEQGIPFATQNRFLAKLAPMKRDVVTR